MSVLRGGQRIVLVTITRGDNDDVLVAKVKHGRVLPSQANQRSLAASPSGQSPPVPASR